MHSTFDPIFFSTTVLCRFILVFFFILETKLIFCGIIHSVMMQTTEKGKIWSKKKKTQHQTQLSVPLQCNRHVSLFWRSIYTKFFLNNVCYACLTFEGTWLFSTEKIVTPVNLTQNLPVRWSDVNGMHIVSVTEIKWAIV